MKNGGLKNTGAGY